MADAKTKPKTTVQRRINQRVEWLKGKMPGTAITPEQKVAIVALISEGATLIEIAQHEPMPSVSTIYRAMRDDKEFFAAMDDARSYAATTAIDEAQHELRAALESGDTDRMSIASAYHRGTMDYAAKVAPRLYGQLLKLAGADGGALTISVTNYSELWGGTLTNDDPSHATQVPGHAALSLQAQDPEARQGS